MDAARVVFERHAAGPEMDGRQFAKLLKMAGMYDRSFKSTDSDLIFAKVKPASQRRIDWLAFEDAMEEVALRRRVDFNDVMDLIANAGTKPLFKPAPRTKQSMTGPERFYYDKNTYTGVHTRGGPSTQDGGMITFERAVKRTAPRSKDPAAPGDEIRRTCPRCMFSWLDKYRKDECPKCFAYIQPPRRASEVARELLQGTVGVLDDSPDDSPSKSRSGRGRARDTVSPQREMVRRQRNQWTRNNPDSPYRRSMTHSFDDEDESPAMVSLRDDVRRADYGDPYDARGDTYDPRGRGPDAYAYDEPKDGGPSAYPPEAPYDPRARAHDHDATQHFDSRFVHDVDSPGMSRTMEQTPPRQYAERTRTNRSPSDTRRYAGTPATRRAASQESPQTRKSKQGPERFFYDKSSYTGTHNKGGPTTSGSGASAGIMGSPKASEPTILGRDPRKAAPTGQKAPRRPGEEVRMCCPTCCHKWVDKYGKNECPKCLSRLW